MGSFRGLCGVTGECETINKDISGMQLKRIKLSAAPAIDLQLRILSFDAAPGRGCVIICSINNSYGGGCAPQRPAIMWTNQVRDCRMNYEYSVQFARRMFPDCPALIPLMRPGCNVYREIPSQMNLLLLC